MVPGSAGRILTVTGNEAETVPDPHALVPCTVILPGTAVAEKETVMMSVFMPEIMLAPVGKVHK